VSLGRRSFLRTVCGAVAAAAVAIGAVRDELPRVERPSYSTMSMPVEMEFVDAFGKVLFVHTVTVSLKGVTEVELDMPAGFEDVRVRCG
jgi:hypothetical protein